MTDQNFTPLEQSMMLLSASKNHLEAALRVIKRGIESEDVKWTVGNYIVILVSSFLHEWGKLEGLGKNDDSVARTIKLAKPALQRIRRYHGLHRLRSALLAHSARHEDGVRNVDAFIGGNKAPLAYAETMVLAECAVYAIAAAHTHHSVTHAHALAKLREIRVEAAQQADTMEDFYAEMNEIKNAMIGIDPEFERNFHA